MKSSIVKQKWFEKNSSPYIRWIKGVYSHSIPVWLYFFLGGLKAQSSAQPRASEAAPWVGLSLVKPFTPWKGKSVDIVLLFRIPSAYWAFSPSFSNFLEVPCFYVFTLLPFQGVDIIFLFHIPRVPLRLPWARRSIGLSARLGCRFACPGVGYSQTEKEWGYPFFIHRTWGLKIFSNHFCLTIN